jgi:hypothetical protein
LIYCLEEIKSTKVTPPVRARKIHLFTVGRM